MIILKNNIFILLVIVFFIMFFFILGVVCRYIFFSVLFKGDKFCILVSKGERCFIMCLLFDYIISRFGFKYYSCGMYNLYDLLSRFYLFVLFLCVGICM